LAFMPSTLVHCAVGEPAGPQQARDAVADRGRAKEAWRQLHPRLPLARALRCEKAT